MDQKIFLVFFSIKSLILGYLGKIILCPGRVISKVLHRVLLDSDGFPRKIYKAYGVYLWTRRNCIFVPLKDRRFLGFEYLSQRRSEVICETYLQKLSEKLGIGVNSSYNYHLLLPWFRVKYDLFLMFHQWDPKRFIADDSTVPKEERYLDTDEREFVHHVPSPGLRKE